MCGEDPQTSESIKKCATFLLKHQNKNGNSSTKLAHYWLTINAGGWGEDFTSCFDKQYAKNGMQRYGDQGSGVVPTSWALLALMDAQCPDQQAGPLTTLSAHCFVVD